MQLNSEHDIRQFCLRVCSTVWNISSFRLPIIELQTRSTRDRVANVHTWFPATLLSR